MADQIVQVGHVCMEAGRLFDIPDHTNLVVCAVCSKERLLDVLDRHKEQFVAFDEPDDNLGITAICSKPISGDARKMFRGFQLWKSLV